MAFQRHWKIKKNAQERTGPLLALYPQSNMVAEPASDPWPSARKQIQTLAKKVKDLERLVNESMGRGILTDVKINRLRSQVAKKAIDQSTQTEEQMVNEEPVESNLEKIINDTFNMEGANVKAVIGPRGDRVNRSGKLPV